MSNTLPRTRSMSAASSTSLCSVSNKEKVRPISLCDTSWHRVTGQDMRLSTMQRSPSQANNLSTTVPTSLVTRNLGGRHTPTRSSLRHSRMVVHGKAQPRFPSKNRVKNRWLTTGVGRVGVLVITAQALVGLMTVTLAVWLLIWTPSMRFTEVPHYSGIPVLLSGILGAVLICCCDKRNLLKFNIAIKGVVAALCCISIVTCMSVCVFTAMHLIHLAPMTCQNQIAVLFQSPTEPINYNQDITTTTFRPQFIENNNGQSVFRNRIDSDKFININRDAEGSGMYPNDLESDAEYNDYTAVELEPSILDVIPAKINYNITVNISYCVCEFKDETNNWSRTLRYPDLSCSDVNQILPILFVASCVLASVGAILSSVVLYLLWTSRGSIYTSKHPETRPFIFTSNFKKNTSIENGNSRNTIKNGNALYR